jgi:mRNA interferase MazF
MARLIRRGEVWSVDFNPQTHKHEPGKRDRPALIIQTDLLNQAGHSTTIVIPGTTNIRTQAPDDDYPLRVRIQKTGKLKLDTDLMIDQVRAIDNVRLIEQLCVLTPVHLKKIEQALKLLAGI